MQASINSDVAKNLFANRTSAMQNQQHLSSDATLVSTKVDSEHATSGLSWPLTKQ